MDMEDSSLDGPFRPLPTSPRCPPPALRCLSAQRSSACTWTPCTWNLCLPVPSDFAQPLEP